MIEYIHIKGFKSLLDTEFNLSNLNIFSGLNGMGKSSLIQTLLLLRQSHEKNTLFNSKGLLLKGDYVNLGTGKDVLSEYVEEDIIDFIFSWADETQLKCQFSYSSKSDLLPCNTIFIKANPENKNLFNKNFQYLSADRISPKTSYEASNYYIYDLNSLGNHGEYTAHYIEEFGQSNIEIHDFKHKNATSLNFLENLDKWMSEISPGIRIHTTLQEASNTISLNYAFESSKDISGDYKPQNVGFGLTFVLPVIVSLLRAKKDDLLIIENPEAHLHPAGQSIIGMLCAIAAHNGVQLFIETHSDHFLNGVRVAVKEKKIKYTEVAIFFIERSTIEKNAVEIVCPEIDSQGRISMWPQGFFDEADRQLEKLL